MPTPTPTLVSAATRELARHITHYQLNLTVEADTYPLPNLDLEREGDTADATLTVLTLTTTTPTREYTRHLTIDPLMDTAMVRQKAELRITQLVRAVLANTTSGAITPDTPPGRVLRDTALSSPTDNTDDTDDTHGTDTTDTTRLLYDYTDDNEHDLSPTDTTRH